MDNFIDLTLPDAVLLSLHIPSHTQNKTELIQSNSDVINNEILDVNFNITTSHPSLLVYNEIYSQKLAHYQPQNDVVSTSQSPDKGDTVLVPESEETMTWSRNHLNK